MGTSPALLSQLIKNLLMINFCAVFSLGLYFFLIYGTGKTSGTEFTAGSMAENTPSCLEIPKVIQIGL